MVDQEQVLRSFLELLSGETIFPSDSEKPFVESKDVSSHRQKTDSFLKEHTHSTGTSLCIPSLSSSRDLKGSLHDRNESIDEEDEDLPNSVLRGILKKGNPLPPKTSYAKGKKKLQKRRSTKVGDLLASISAAAATVAEEDDGKSHCSSPSTTPVRTKAQDIQDKIGRSLTYVSTVTDSSDDTTMESTLTDNNTDAKSLQGLSNPLDLSKALDTLHQNLNGTVQALLQSQLISLITVLVYKSMRSKGRVSNGASKILATFLDDESYSEEDDHKSVLQSLKTFHLSGDGAGAAAKKKQNEQSPNGRNIDISLSMHSIQEDDVDMSTMGSESDSDPFGHIAKISSIHTKPLSDQMAEYKVEIETRPPQTSIDKCTTSFSLSPTGIDKSGEIDGGESVETSKKCALLFGAVFHIEVMESKAIIEFGTSGSIEGKFDDSKLTNAFISLDIKGLFQSIIREINKSLKTVLHEKKPMSAQASTPNKTRLSQREIRRGAASARALSGLGTSSNASFDSSSRPTSKRALESSSHSIHSLESFSKRPKNNIDGVDSIETASDLLRMASGGNSLGNMFQNQYNPGALMNNSVNSMAEGLLGMNKESAANNLVSAMRKAEFDKALSTLSAGNTGLGMNGGTSGLGSVSAAAEAIRLADGDKNFNSAFNRRSSFGNNMAATAEAVRLSEMENVLSASLRRASRGGDSLSPAVMEALSSKRNLPNNSANNNDAIRCAEIESAMRRGDSSSLTAAVAAAEASRRTSFSNGRRSSFGNNMTTADMVRMAEMESVMSRPGGRRTSFNGPGNDPADTMASALDSIRMAEMESALRRNSRADSLAVASEAIRLAERTRRSSLTEAMRLVEMDALRRSSAGTSMAAAADAVRLAELESFRMDAGINGMMSPSNNYGHQNRFYRNGDNQSVESLAALLQHRRSSGPVGSMLTAAEAVRLEQERSWRSRRSSGPTGSMAANAAEVARLADSMDNDHTQAPRQRIGMNQPSGRRVSFGPDTLHDQLSRFRHGI